MKLLCGLVVLRLLFLPGASWGDGLRHPIGLSVTEFADQLAQEGRWDLAELEYRRALALSSEDSLAVRARAAIGVAQAMRRVRPLSELLGWVPLQRAVLAPTAMDRLYLESARAALDADRPELVKGLLLPVTDESVPERAILEGIAAIHQQEWELAEERFRSVPLSSPLHGVALEFDERAARGPDVPMVSPSRAMLAGVVPGGGYLYSGYPQTALSAAIVTSVCALGTREAFRSDQDTLGWFLGVITFTWYSGSIYGSALSARHVNHARLERFELEFPY